jgi:DNA-binding MarR family transcriptional regulator
MTWTAEQATHELLQILPRLNSMIGAEMRAAAGEETTMPQFRVLAQLSEAPQTLSALAKWRRVSLQAMSVLVQSLVDRGWIERLPDPSDRRQQVLQLTKRGHTHYQRAQTRIVQRLLPLMEALSAEELRAVAQALPALGRVLSQADDSVIPPPEVPGG